jgi:hypothetical protein
MSKRLVFAALAALLAGSLAGCVVTPAYTVAPAAAPPLVADNTTTQASYAPPPLPDYDQPPAPEPGYIWTPGVWHWGPDGYYWVPGTWIAPPAVGMLWTPGFWALSGVVYVFHPGYWGTHVGYYGGVNYGHGYYGDGYVGGRWNGGNFEYNTAVTNVNVTTIHNTYIDNTVTHRASTTSTMPRGAYSGAPGNPMRQVTPIEGTAAGEPHYAMTQPQSAHHNGASTIPTQSAVRNEGHPPVAATPRPSEFQHPQVTAAKPGPAWHPPAPEGHPSAPQGGQQEHH